MSDTPAGTRIGGVAPGVSRGEPTPLAPAPAAPSHVGAAAPAQSDRRAAPKHLDGFHLDHSGLG